MEGRAAVMNEIFCESHGDVPAWSVCQHIAEAGDSPPGVHVIEFTGMRIAICEACDRGPYPMEVYADRAFCGECLQAGRAAARLRMH